ncbi:RluA family pseudouridine synthase [Treponema pectinovorum]|uniref:RluA family pseudouridine synthase n=1 Tax=Treponema pectinovorum TaxID=164 RepID=UPI003D8B2C6F
MPFIDVKVPENYSLNERADKYLSSLENGMNRSKLKSGVTEILINSKNAKLSTKIKAGDTIFVQWEDNIPTDIIPQDIPLDIIYEDKNVTVVNKKVNMVTHPAAGNWNGTLVNALLYHWGRKSLSNKTKGQIIEPQRPGIVHRLDKDTSGIIITAKNRETEEFLGNQFKNHNQISKIYICICKGHPPVREGLIKTKIMRDSRDRKKFRVCDLEGEGKIAISKFKCIACYGPYSLIKVKIYTGRTHQIRVHLKFLGCPILGDKIYSKSNKENLFGNAPMMLHSFKLKIKIPEKTEIQTFYAKLPLRFKKVLKKLHSSFKKSLPPEKIEGNFPFTKTSKNPKIQLFLAKKGYGQWQK